jgi:predicted kinase
VTTIKIPELCLVVLVGITGSGKSTFAARHFRRTEVLSSDFFRGLVGDDENDQSVTAEAFGALQEVAARRLRLGRLTVIDATSVRPDDRRPLIELAREYHVLPVAIVLDVPPAVAAGRNAARPGRDFGAGVVKRQHAALTRSAGRLAREGFRRVFVLRGVAEVEEARVEREPSWTDKSAVHGPFDIIGDVHGCQRELAELLGKLGYASDGGVPAHPAGRTAVFLGDLVDRGPDTPGVLRTVMGMVAAGSALCVPGNHEAKLLRALRGRDVTVSHGLAQSLAQLAAEPSEFRDRVVAFLDGLISHYVLDGGRLVVAHAGLPAPMHGRASAAVRAFALYGDTTGETDEFGLPVRYPWAQDYRGRAAVVYGHTPVAEPAWVNNTICLDTGCVFGGRLTALRYPERELVSVPAAQVYYQPTRPLAPGTTGPPGAPGAGPAPGTLPAPGAVPAPGALPASGTLPAPGTLPVPGTGAGSAVGDGGGASLRGGTVVGGGAVVGGRAVAGDRLLDVADVLGRRGIETPLRGRVTIPEPNAAAALEIMSRFAADPRWLIYLPPAMPPVPASERPGLLEHPADALAAYRGGTGTVVCEEKHMGSRAVVIACQRPEAALDWFGTPAPGIVYTRTGRRFFARRELEEELLGRVSAALAAAGLWQELGEWAALDCEILPWSLKAEELVREQYAAVGAAATASLGAAAGLLAAARERGAPVAALHERTLARQQAAQAFTAAYRPYVWPVTSLADVRVAPFQVLAGATGSRLRASHRWHMAAAQRLAEADPLILPTRHLVADLADPGAEAAVTAWWEDLTGTGGEGMVVKPLEPVTHGSRGLVQPGVKCRGPEYLRIIYGPEYRLPPNLARLRERNLGRKRSLALSEFALGVEALDRFVRREPLFRVHECVFGVLALESEPVDPRL